MVILSRPGSRDSDGPINAAGPLNPQQLIKGEASCAEQSRRECKKVCLHFFQHHCLRQSASIVVPAGAIALLVLKGPPARTGQFWERAARDIRSLSIRITNDLLLHPSRSPAPSSPPFIAGGLSRAHVVLIQ